MKLKNFLIVVKDIENSKRFYHELFGLETVLDSEGNVILEPEYQYFDGCGENGWLVARKGARQIYMEADGNIMLEVQCEGAGDFKYVE